VTWRRLQRKEIAQTNQLEKVADMQSWYLPGLCLPGGVRPKIPKRPHPHLNYAYPLVLALYLVCAPSPGVEWVQHQDLETKSSC